MNDGAESSDFSVELAEAARRVLGKRVKRRAPYEASAAAANAELWPVAAELGWFQLATPEERGGLGLDFTALGALYLELGRSVSPLPLLTTMLAVQAARETVSSHVDASLAAIGTGEAIVAAQTPGSRPASARRIGDGFVLDGRLVNGLFPTGATHLLVQAELSGESALFLLGLTDEIKIEPKAPWDRTRELADAGLVGVRAPSEAMLAEGDAARRLIGEVSSHFDLALACDSLGGAEQILDETVEYSKTRRQFGREIGSFQALKHRCAEMKTSLEAAKALTQLAVRTFAAGDWQSPLIAGAKVLATEVYRTVAMDAVQIHGGIGFTWEHDCHLFLKRALLNEVLGGSPEDYKDRLFEPMRNAAQMAHS